MKALPGSRSMHSAAMLLAGCFIGFLAVFGTLPGEASAQSAAQNYEAGLRAFNRAQYEEAEAQWLPLARSGDLRSQYALAVLYEKRAGRDPELMQQAAEWYRRAAEQGHPGGQTNYASLLARGSGVEQDQRKAIHFWRLAAEQDNALAQYNLGLAYYRGEGVVPDSTRALAWFRRAADAGMADAQFAMGQMNALGVGTARNSGRALTWFQMAEAQGHNDAGRQAQRLREEGTVAEKPGPPLPVPGEGSGEGSGEVAQASPEPTQPQEMAAGEPQGADAQQEAVIPPVKPEETPAKIEEPTPDEVSENGTSLWLGSFADREAAETFRTKTLDLYAQNFAERPISIVQEAGRYRVLVAGLPDEEAADLFCAALRRDIDNAFCALLKP